MQQVILTTCSGVSDPALRAMFEARKRVFVDLLKWDVPVLDDSYEVDEFDTPAATYLVLTQSDGSHRASARLLRANGPHILRDLYPRLCRGPVPSRADFREITRFCVEPTLPRGERRRARDELVSALADYAMDRGISGYTAVAPVSWFRQIAGFGWQCRALGASETIAGQALVAFQIDIDRSTRKDLETAGIYCRDAFRLARTKLEMAA